MQYFSAAVSTGPVRGRIIRLEKISKKREVWECRSEHRSSRELILGRTVDTVAGEFHSQS